MKLLLHTKILQALHEMQFVQNTKIWVWKENIFTRSATNEIHLHGPNQKDHPPLSQGHQYALTVICMLTGLTFCTPIKTKNEEVVYTYLKYISLYICGKQKNILSDKEYIWHNGDNNDGVTTRGCILSHAHFRPPHPIMPIVPYIRPYPLFMHK